MPLARNAVFDLDGVIVDSEPTHERANAEYAAAIGATYGADLQAAMMGRPVRDLTDALAALAGRPPEEVFAGREELFWRLLHQGLAPMPGLHAAVARLTDAGLALAVASSGTRDYVEHVLVELGVRDAFKAVVSSQDVTHAKPHPEVYLLAARRLGAHPAQCVALEDAPHGIAAARAAGMKVIAIPHPLVAGLDLSGADLVAPGLAEATAMILAPGS